MSARSATNWLARHALKNGPKLKTQDSDQVAGSKHVGAAFGRCAAGADEVLGGQAECSGINLNTVLK